MFTLNNAQMLAAMTQLLAVGGPYHTTKLALVTAGPLPPGPGNVLADYTLATYTGATPVALTFGAPYVDLADGQAYVDAFAAFPCTAPPATAETITGYILTDTGGTNVIGGDVINPSITISAAGQSVVLVVRLRQQRVPGGAAVVIP